MSLKHKLQLNTLFVAHDSGGANLLISLSRQFQGEKYFKFSGPALKLLGFEHEIISEVNEPFLKQGIQLVVTGTSTNSDLEINYIDLARVNKVSTISVLDNWSNYRERFTRNSKITLPNLIWVCDNYAYSIAKKEFQGIQINKIPNFYLEEILKTISSRSNTVVAKEVRKVLYACEPPGKKALNDSQNPNYLGYSEVDAISYFLSNLKIAFPQCKELTFRLHPSNPYFPLEVAKIQLKGLKIRVSESDLSSDISEADAVVGTNSMVLYIAMLAKRLPVSAIPPRGYPCTIPDSRIIDFRSLLV